MDEEKLQIADPENSSMVLMKQLADNDITKPVDINAEKLIDRTKLFLVVRARNSLNRIIKLTATLEKLEDKFISTLCEAIDDGPSLQMLSTAMETLTLLIKDANDTVMQIMKDDKLQSVVINTTNIITQDGKHATVIDPDSRDAIRNVAGSLLRRLSSISSEEELDDIIDVESEDTGDDDSASV